MDKILSPLYFCNETWAFTHFTWGVAGIWHLLTTQGSGGRAQPT